MSSESKIKSFFPWDSQIIIVTTITNVILALCVWSAFNDGELLLKIFSLSVITIPVLFLPIRLVVTSEDIKIWRPGGRVKIKISEIKSCWVIEDSDEFFDDAKRTFGSGGAYGALGHFKHDKHDKMRCFITHTDQCFFIKMKNGKNFVISSPKRREIVKSIGTIIKNM